MRQETWILQLAEKAYTVYRITVEKAAHLPDGNLREWSLLDSSEQSGWIAAAIAISYTCLQKEGADAAIASVIEQGRKEFLSLCAG